MKNNKLKIIFITLSIILISIVLLNNQKSTIKGIYISEDNIKENKQQIGIYLEQDNGSYKHTDNIPTKEEGYVLNTSDSVCDGSTSITWDNDTWSAVIKNINQNNLKCYLYFRKLALSEQTLNKLGKTSTPGETGGFGTTDASEHNTLYSDKDDFGTTYYYRGRVKDNWVKFGKNKSNQDIYWRIIRINGDGTIRLIYAGEGNPATRDGGYTTNGTNALINKATNVKYYGSYNQAEYVGFQFKIGIIHGHGTDSTIAKSNVLIELNTWFEENLADTNSNEWNNGSGKIDKNAGFCNDRRNSTSYMTKWGSEQDDGGTGSETNAYYGAHLRLRPGGNNPDTNNKSIPTFKCKDINNDNFTYTGADQKTTTDNKQTSGTNSLQYPVGLITADEVTFAGGLYGQNNTNYYLNNQNGYYWTMSPYFFYTSSGYPAQVFDVTSSGYLNNNRLDDTDKGVRPVINLKADTTFKPGGTGEYNNPYEVS